MPFLFGLLLLATSSPSLPDPKDAWLHQFAICESNASSTIKVLDTNHYYSYGLFQFQQRTWLAYGKEFGATKENILNPVLQYVVARKMLDEGGQNHWYTCSKQVTSLYGSYPAD